MEGVRVERRHVMQQTWQRQQGGDDTDQLEWGEEGGGESGGGNDLSYELRRAQGEESARVRRPVQGGGGNGGDDAGHGEEEDNLRFVDDVTVSEQPLHIADQAGQRNEVGQVESSKGREGLTLR